MLCKRHNLIWFENLNAWDLFCRHYYSQQRNDLAINNAALVVLQTQKTQEANKFVILNARHQGEFKRKFLATWTSLRNVDGVNSQTGDASQQSWTSTVTGPVFRDCMCHCYLVTSLQCPLGTESSILIHWLLNSFIHLGITQESPSSLQAMV